MRIVEPLQLDETPRFGESGKIGKGEGNIGCDRLGCNLRAAHFVK